MTVAEKAIHRLMDKMVKKYLFIIELLALAIIVVFWILGVREYIMGLVSGYMCLFILGAVSSLNDYNKEKKELYNPSRRYFIYSYVVKHSEGETHFGGVAISNGFFNNRKVSERLAERFVHIIGQPVLLFLLEIEEKDFNDYKSEKADIRQYTAYNYIQ